MEVVRGIFRGLKIRTEDRNKKANRYEIVLELEFGELERFQCSSNVVLAFRIASEELGFGILGQMIELTMSKNGVSDFVVLDKNMELIKRFYISAHNPRGFY